MEVNMLSKDQIKNAVDLAWASVEAAELPDGIGNQYHLTIFTEVLRRTLDGDQVPAAHAGGQQVQAAGRQATPATPADADTGLSRLAARLFVAENALADVFAVEGGNVMLHVASTRIATTKSRATREIALLVTAARQGADIDESWTDVSHIRDALAQYNRYDISNFSRYLRETGDVFNFRGKPIQQLRLTRPGWEAATQLVKTLTGSV
jgi:hypothetical protein